MIVATLTLALLASIGLILHFIGTGELWEAVKAAITAGGIFVLLAATLTVRRAGRRAGY